MLRIFADPESLSRGAAELFVELAAAAIQARGRFAVSLSGGSTPKRTYEHLAEAPLRDRVAWNKVHLFWGDERCVPPDDARSFIDFLASKRAPKLDQLSYSVLALGDSSYPKFCEAGRIADERLAALGASRVADRIDCDIDLDAPATAWTDTVLHQAAEILKPSGDAPRLDTTLSAPTRDYYPRDALEQEIEGKVALSARIDPQGCVRAAAVLVSSGVPALDEAALRWVLEGAVYTRSKPRPGGQPASASLSVNFKASD